MESVYTSKACRGFESRPLRQTAIAYPDDTNTYFEYDAVGNLLAARAQSSEASGEGGHTYFEYDAVNRLTAEVSPAVASGGGGPITTSYTYDPVGNRTSVAVSGSNTSYYAYDPANRMEHAVSADVGATYYTYDAVGGVIKKVLGNGCYAYFEYDAANRVTSIKNCKADASPLCYFIYDYDAASRITLIQRENGDTIYYGYDDADRLISEAWKDAGGASIYAFSWDYDAVGNRTWESRDGVETYYEYNAANELTDCVTDGEYSYYSYDSRGNCVQIEAPAGTQYFTYDHRDLVSGIRYRDASTQYFHHDAQMRMYCMEDSETGTSYFTWDKNGLNILCERDAEGNVIAEYTHGYTPIDGIGSMVAARKEQDGATYYQYPIYDGIKGNLHRLVNQNGILADVYEYNAWGVVLGETQSGASNRFAWQSNWLRLKEGIHKSPARLYLDDIGRFLQGDPQRSGKQLMGRCGGLGTKRSRTNRQAVVNSLDSLGRIDNNGLVEHPYSAGSPPLTVDPTGCWTKRLHGEYTEKWATIGAHYKKECAEILATACKGVDSPFWGMSPWPWVGNYSYHFDTTPSGLVRKANARRESHDEEVRRAGKALTKMGKRRKWPFRLISRSISEGYFKSFLKHLGRSLHPMQDVYSHSKTHDAETPLHHAPAWICGRQIIGTHIWVPFSGWRYFDWRWGKEKQGGATDKACEKLRKSPNWYWAGRPDSEFLWLGDVERTRIWTEATLKQWLKDFPDLQCKCGT